MGLQKHSQTPRKTRKIKIARLFKIAFFAKIPSMRSFLETRDPRVSEAYDNFLKDKLLQALEDRSVYKTADVPILDSVTIAPGQQEAIRIPLSPSNLPILDKVPIQALDFMSISVRSRWAQAGLDIGGPLERATLVHTKPGGFEYSQEHKAHIAKVWAKNHAARPLNIPAGSNLYRYFYIDDRNQVQGEELAELIRHKDLQIFGRYGEDWSVQSELGKDGKPTPSRICLTVHSETFRAVNPFDPTPLTVSDDSSDFREELDQALIPAAPSLMRQLLIGETVGVKMPQGVNGKLSPLSLTPFSLNGFEGSVLNYQTCSRLLDGGRNWPIRVEIETMVYPDVSPRFVHLSLYEE